MPAKEPVDIYRDNRNANRLIVEDTRDGNILAWCYVGDDENVEAIADLLSVKRLPNSAMKFRQMAMDARKRPGVGNGVRVTGL
jgi:hypothetical protein